MLKGCKKDVVYVKNTGSELFDEAYFILSPRSAFEKKENDILAEASRIIANTPASSYFASKPKEKGKNRLSILSFILGAALMAALNTLIYLLI